MPSFNVHEAKTQFSKFLDRVLEGEQVLITCNGVPIAELVPAGKRGVVLGSGIGGPGYKPEAPDDWWRPMADEEVEAFLEGRY